MDRIEEIVKEAEKRLDAFYGYYGEWDGKRKKGDKKKKKKDEETEDDDFEPEELISEKPEKSEKKGRPSKKYLFDDIEEEDASESDLFSKELSKEDENDFFKNGPIAEPKVIKKIESPKKKPVIVKKSESKSHRIKPVKKLETKKRRGLSENLSLDSARDSSGNVINFKGLKSIEIINKVKELTGEHINICVKSKKNVIRHAIIILKERGYIIR